MQQILVRALIEHTWDVCYLGYSDPAGPFQTLAQLSRDHQLTRVFGCNCAHAYLIKALARGWIIERLPSGTSIWKWLSRYRAVDRWYLRTLGQRFCIAAVSPSIVNQAPGFSDIVTRNTSHPEESGHVISVIPHISKKYPVIRHLLRRRFTQLHAFYDIIRGFYKFLRGF
jgi:hypothetical protein